MALTLKEILELQRRQREEKAAQPPLVAPVPRPETPLQPSPTTIAQANQVHDRIEKPAVSGLLARLQKANGSAPQTHTSAESLVRKAVQQGAASLIGDKIVVTVIQPPAQQYTADETETLRKNLAFLASNMEEASVIGQVLRTTVKQLQEHPELSSIMIDSDYDLIVAAARRSMKFAVRKKDDRSEKGMKKKADGDELMKWMKDAGFEL